jgi:hypothetical protein
MEEGRDFSGRADGEDFLREAGRRTGGDGPPK